MCLERELCSEARKLADAGKHTVGIEDKRTPAQTQYEMFYIPKVLHTAWTQMREYSGISAQTGKSI